MKIKRLIIIFGLAWLLCYAFGQSQPPIKQAKSNENGAGPAAKNGAKESPLRVDSVGLPTPQFDPYQHTNETEDKASDWWMVRLTAGLFIVGAGQLWMFKKQLGIMKDSLRDTEGAANAAKQSADAAEKTVKIMDDTARRQLRPYVSASVAALSNFSHQITPALQVRLTNHGQIPARRVQVRLDVIVRPIAVGDDFAVPEIRNGWTPESVVWPNGSDSEDRRPLIAQPAGARFTPNEIENIRSGALVIYLLGLVR